MSRQSRYFYIKSKLNGLVLDLSGGSDDPGTEVCMWEKKEEDNDNQLWYINFQTSTIRSKLNDMVLEVQYDDNRLVVNPYEEEEPFNQRWTFGHDTIHHTCLPNRVMDIIDCDDSPGAKVGAWSFHGGENQLWELEYLEPKYFFIVSGMNGKVLDIEDGSADPGACIHTWSKHGGDNQLWWEDNRGRLRSKLCDLAVEDVSRDRGSQHSIRTAEPEEGKPNQFWAVGRNRVYNRMKPSQVFDIKGFDDDDGAKIWAFKWHGGDNQKWEKEYVD